MEAAGKELLNDISDSFPRLDGHRFSCRMNWQTSVLCGALVFAAVLMMHNMLGRSLFCCTVLEEERNKL